MDVKQITTRVILETLGIVPENGLPQRGEYKCYLEYGGYDVKNFNDDLLFFFRIEFELQRGLHIGLPDGTISDICENSRTFHPTQNQFFIDYIHHRCSKSWDYPEDLVYVCFSVLHEFGHWEYFLARGLTLEEYKFFDYRNIPSEKAADEFAFNLLIDLIKEILNRIKIS